MQMQKKGGSGCRCNFLPNLPSLAHAVDGRHVFAMNRVLLSLLAAHVLSGRRHVLVLQQPTMRARLLRRRQVAPPDTASAYVRKESPN